VVAIQAVKFWLPRMELLVVYLQRFGKVAGSSVPEEADLVEIITDKALQVQQIDLMERV
jgi:hypothetical protein